ncbi:MAG: hypothetical protein WAM73_16520 [Desulfobacterales bacterium]
MNAATGKHSDRGLDRATLVLLRESVSAMDAAVATDSAKIKTEAEAAEERIVTLRDHLIEHLRQDVAGKAATLRPLLDQVNMALSLIVSIEYPAGGIHREALTEAREVLSGSLARVTARAPV